MSKYCGVVTDKSYFCTLPDEVGEFVTDVFTQDFQRIRIYSDEVEMATKRIREIQTEHTLNWMVEECR